jgi:hypothetical protein
MTTKGVKMGFVTRGPGKAAPTAHDVLVAGYRAKLAGRQSLFDRVTPEQLELARKEFSELPEVSGEPFPVKGKVK